MVPASAHTVHKPKPRHKGAGEATQAKPSGYAGIPLAKAQAPSFADIGWVARGGSRGRLGLHGGGNMHGEALAEGVRLVEQLAQKELALRGCTTRREEDQSYVATRERTTGWRNIRGEGEGRKRTEDACDLFAAQQHAEALVLAEQLARVSFARSRAILGGRQGEGSR